MSTFVLFTLGALALLVAVVMQFVLAGRQVEQWALANGFVIVEKVWRALRRGPFTFTGGNRVIYHVVVTYSQGAQRWGFVAAGGWFSGLLSDNVVVKWESEL
jgi:hypothetical protein